MLEQIKRMILFFKKHFKNKNPPTVPSEDFYFLRYQTISSNRPWPGQLF